MSGWIKIYREIAQHWIFQDAEKFKWWIDLLFMAAHEDYKTLINGNLVCLKRGQLSVSLSFLATKWGRSKEKVLNFLKLLESDNMITRKSDRKSTTITICNYESYQDVPEQTPTTEPTEDRPISDQSPTEYKNVEECKEDINKHTNSACAREDNFGLKVGVLASEEQYIKRYQQEGLWSDAAMSAHLTIPEVQQIFEEFVVEQKHNSSRHSDYSDFKRHFLNYLRVKAEMSRKQSNSNSNGNQRKYDDRRGTEVSSSADYTKPL